MPAHPQQTSSTHWASQRLYRLGLWGAGAGLVLLLAVSPISDPLSLGLGAIMFVLAILPALRWAKFSRSWFPVFEIFMLTGVVFYAIPFLTERSDTVEFSNDVLQHAALAVISFQLTAIWSFGATRGRPSTSWQWIRPLIPDSSLKLSLYGLWLSTIYQFIAQYSTIIPYQYMGVSRAMFFGLGIISIFIQSRLWGEGKLTTAAKVTLVLNMLAQSIVLASQLYLINVISIFGLALIGYVTTSRKVPLLVIALVFPVLTVLHSGKSAMRQVYWTSEVKYTPDLAELTDFYTEWVEYGIASENERDATDESHASLLQRASLFQIIAVTVAKVPQDLPYLGGETYVDIPALFVPRLFWPNKPTALETNVRLSLYFGLVEEYSAETVSIAFGMLAESYANFGFFGTIGLGFVLGHLFKRVTTAGENAATFSPLGIFVILLTAWSLQVEMVAATWISSLFQATLVTVILPMVGIRLMGR